GDCGRASRPYSEAWRPGKETRRTEYAVGWDAGFGRSEEPDRRARWSGGARRGMGGAMDLSLSVDAVLTGPIALIAPDVLSAIGKVPTAAPVRVGWLGLEGDAQAD